MHLYSHLWLCSFAWIPFLILFVLQITMQYFIYIETTNNFPRACMSHLQSYITHNKLNHIMYTQDMTCTMDIHGHTVDGRNPAPPGMYKNLVNHGKNYQPPLVIAGFLNHQLINSRLNLIVHVCIYIYMIYMGVSKNRGTPKRMVYNGKPY